MSLTDNSAETSLDRNVETFVSPKKPRFRRLKALGSASIHALPDEVKGLKETFSQAREDMANVRRLSAEAESEETEISVSRWDVAKFMAWRWGMATPYQVGDDIPGLAVFMKIQESFGTPIAYTATTLGSTALAFAVGMGERKNQQVKASKQGLETTDYQGEMTHKLLDSTVNSGPWNVMQTASAPRTDGEPVQIMTPAQVAEMGAAYGVVNTAFYAGSTAIPGLNSWGAFGVALATMYQLKGTIRGYQERMQEES